MSSTLMTLCDVYSMYATCVYVCESVCVHAYKHILCVCTRMCVSDDQSTSRQACRIHRYKEHTHSKSIGTQGEAHSPQSFQFHQLYDTLVRAKYHGLK